MEDLPIGSEIVLKVVETKEADLFARLTRKEIDYTHSGKYLCVGDLWMYCIPYNEETAHLLGTTDEWKGGER